MPRPFQNGFDISWSNDVSMPAQWIRCETFKGRSQSGVPHLVFGAYIINLVKPQRNLNVSQKPRREQGSEQAAPQMGPPLRLTALRFIQKQALKRMGPEIFVQRCRCVLFCPTAVATHNSMPSPTYSICQN